jgi:hypothetical protein
MTDVIMEFSGMGLKKAKKTKTKTTKSELRVF